VKRAAAFLVCLAGCAAQSRTVALTFDDLPVVGMKNATEAKSINRPILAALARHHAPATGFVIESKLQQIGAKPGAEILQEWLRQGLDLGNHTFSHRDLNDLTAAEFENDVLQGEASIGKPRYLRFPFNHTGDTQEKHDAVAALLAKHGYRVATCTIDNEDYEFARTYEVMLARKDDVSARRLRAEYLAYTAVEIDYYNDLHKQVFGREIPQVMLLHANRLNAELIDKVLHIFEQKHYRFVTLDQAQSDAAYSTPEIVSKYGEMWGYRWAKQLGVKVNGSPETEPSAWMLHYR
jgi:peptidoglycan/xylan/chitin deacetylase (PgdA/CDA1 family)